MEVDRLSSFNNCVLDVNKLASPQSKLVDLNLYKSDQDDEGEIMLLAMILLQLHGVKLPSSDEDSDLLNKKKRQRTSPDQLAILEQIFQTDKMPNQQTRVHLADQLGMSSRRVQIWFQNKRAKVKRSVSRTDGDCSSPLDSLADSSSSISAPSSPSSPSSAATVPPLENGSPSVTPASPTLAAVVPQLHHLSTLRSSSNPLKRSLSFETASILISSPVPASETPSTPTSLSHSTNSFPLPTPTTPNNSLLDSTTKHLKSQLQFSFDTQSILTASY